MAYAGVEDVLARAGALAEAWDDSTTPGYAEITRFLADTAAEINVGFAAAGVQAPVVDELAKPALRGYNADRALLLAIDATWPGSSSRDDVKDLRDAISARVSAADSELAAGDLPALMFLLGQSSVDQEVGASNFWTSDAVDYDYGMWSRHIDTFWRYGLDPWGIPVGDGPSITRGMSL